ncbi:TAXI family TRAP transporter solute-binding subunit [Hydrogenophaga sp. 5NK40-0174]|uniref:TAXI family TRAP transporter solute-binding subunit n=1 Tax=Hydrogenophaga sp. 5NK40-0174 TaxID=3127649 RepID=UPI00310BF0C0
MTLAKLYHLRWPLIRLPLMLLALGVCLLVWWKIYPMPKAQLVISAGIPDGAYQAYANRYAQALAERGIEAEVLGSAGSEQNLDRIRSAPPAADLAFVQGGFGWSAFDAPPEAQGRVVTMATVDFEGLWLFTPDVAITDLIQLTGKRVAIGPEGSGHRVLFMRLLKQTDVPANDLTLMDLTGQAAVEALDDGLVDAVFAVASPGAPMIQSLLKRPRARLAALEQTGAIVERNNYLSHRLLAQDALGPDRPAIDTSVLTTPTHLVARHDLDPALIRTITSIATTIHSGEGVFHRQGELPSIRFADFPSSPESRTVMTSGLGWMEAHLPFKVAQVLQRVLLIGLPVFLITGLLMAVIPAWIRLVLEGRISRWYGELRFIENDLRENLLEAGGLEMSRINSRLKELERALSTIKLPPELAHRWFTLHQHVAYVRTYLRRYRGR